MATLVLSAAGAAIGGSLGSGAVAGVTAATAGRMAGAVVGRQIDEALLGAGSDPVEQGRVDQFRITQSTDGTPIPRIWGRMRVGGQVIWASQFSEHSQSVGSAGGKGAPRQPDTTSYSYSVSLAIALGRGPILRVPRLWANGEEIALTDVNLRLYTGTQTQQPDPLMEAIEGPGQVPAYRGTAYVVLEDLDLSQFGNRLPQFSFEVLVPAPEDSVDFATDPAQMVTGVALMPGTGEYALAPDPVYLGDAQGGQWPANLNSPSGQTDYTAALDALGDEMPAARAVSLIVSWFGDDLRCDRCILQPKVERRDHDGVQMPWVVSGVTRDLAQEVPRQVDDRPIYGGTPADASVIAAIRDLKTRGHEVMFYPFVLMEQTEGNTRPDPWQAGATGQPALPWRGRITLSAAPGQPDSPDGTAAARSQVQSFFGTVTARDFDIDGETVSYSGPEEWSLSRFVLHYAAVCAVAGGVESFCIGSEFRSLTQIRDDAGFPAVAALRDLAAEVRQLLPLAKLSYAADWSEYFGYQPEGSQDRYFHLDPLWADSNIDFIGIDNYMPLSDWRDTPDHRDAEWEAIYNVDYLRANIAGGEGYDWFYAHDLDRDAQNRTPITDGEGEAWIWRYKDLRGWWENPHHERINGQRQTTATAWQPRSKPIRFTELGCAAIDKGTNQPNKFLDPASSESRLPYFSTGARDDLIQRAYLEAMFGYWRAAAHNPVSPLYGAPMVDMEHAYAWAWDARPYPAFPAYRDLWADGQNYGRGHWLNGRVGARALAAVVRDICHEAGVTAIDTSRLYGLVRGYHLDQLGDARAALQPLMVRYGFDAVERAGVLEFVTRYAVTPQTIPRSALATHKALTGAEVLTRAPEAELTGRVRLRFAEADGDHALVSEEAVRPDWATHAISTRELPLSMTRGEAQGVAARWLAETRLARDGLQFALPPSWQHLGAGDVVAIEDVEGVWRIDRVEAAGAQKLDAVRSDPGVFAPASQVDAAPRVANFVPPAPARTLYMDLPLLRGDETPHAPHVAATAAKWPGDIAIYGALSDDNYALRSTISGPSIAGRLTAPLPRHAPGRWDNHGKLDVRLISGTVQSRDSLSVLNGANVAAIGDGHSGEWEVIQFRSAELIGRDMWRLSGLLRGQAGSEAVMPEAWGAGSWFVLLDDKTIQLPLSPSERGLDLHLRSGPARKPSDDPSYAYDVLQFHGVGLRPFAPVHLHVDQSAADWQVSWIRRGRVDSDDWTAPEIPLGEDSEQYLVRVTRGDTVLREELVTASTWLYTAAAQNADGVAEGDVLSVAQISATVGAGPDVRIGL